MMFHVNPFVPGAHHNPRCSTCAAPWLAVRSGTAPPSPWPWLTRWRGRPSATPPRWSGSTDAAGHGASLTPRRTQAR